MKSSALKAGDYHPFYEPYIQALGEVELMDMLKRQKQNFPQFINSIPEEKLGYAYAEGKWTIAEVLMHILDAERVFQYRALRFARNDKTPLPGFEQDAYVPLSGAGAYSKSDFVANYEIVRASSIALFDSFSEVDLQRVGIASNSEMSVAALGFIICGHQKHHRNVIRAKYLDA